MNLQSSREEGSVSTGKKNDPATPVRSRKSAEMAKVRTRDTAPEMAVRSVLHRAGHRFKLHDRRLPGTPDIVLPRHRLAIFVHGCFWHGHTGCKRSKLPASRIEFWREKIARNAARDVEAVRRLQSMGWRTLTLWSCELRDRAAIATALTPCLDMGRLMENPAPQASKSRRSSRKTVVSPTP